jgi:hypothetical protein
VRAVLLCVFALAGCKNTTDPILKDRYCLKSHTEVRIIAMPMTTCSKTCTTTTRMQPMPVTVCDKAMWIEYPNPDYEARPHD